MTTPRHSDAAAGCPFQQTAGDGCPVSTLAEAFDAFEGAYQVDPAEALRWSRDQAPVFYAPKLGYWVVSRYDDIKAVFRDNLLFSPCNVLEKVTPVRQEAMDVLASYNYGMDRTLVNEDEPAHMERRRALLEHFIPENLEARQERVRRLTREKMDAFINTGRIDLVNAMLYEIPLTVALQFLGVPEDDMETLRRFSVAHTVNTWGRPTPEQQISVAHSVGQFWQYAGQVLEKMRAEPDGPGWMHYAIRRNAEMPEVVTDNYLHSMMMAIIVAAHETTAHASANMFKLLLTHRQAWEDICADPSLIPNAVEECLRFAGSIVAWRRRTTAATELNGVALPEGANLLMVMASANQDERHFEDGDRFDIYRDNAVEHLSFGYGSHQCMGKNIARMEMRIFLEEMSRRLPHLQLAEQTFRYLPNTSFRGPENLWVEWNPRANPERNAPERREQQRHFPVGAPSRKDIARPVRISEVRREARGVLGLTLEDARGRLLPNWSAGAHVELCLGDYERKYSLCGPADGDRLQVAVRLEEDGRGGSRYLHETVREGMELKLRGPANLFPLAEDAPHYLLVAGGIGITPIIAMADRLKKLGRSYEIHYAGRSRAAMAFVDRLQRDHGAVLTLHAGDQGRRMDLAALVDALPEHAHLYACGPDRMIAALEEKTAERPTVHLHFEHFSSSAPGLDPEREQPFDVTLDDSGLTLRVPADATLLETIRAAGIDVASDCCEGLCGSCEVEVLEGDIDHRDRVLTRDERHRNRRMMSCCSRSRNGKPLTLRL